METQSPAAPALRISLLGPVAVTRAGVAVALPRSRKVRALLGFLALHPDPVSRSQLCDLLWDVPNDPRGELRWCLSKVRALVDDVARFRVVTRNDQITLDLSDCYVDAVEVERAMRAGIDHLPQTRLAELCDAFSGDLLDGVDIDGNPKFSGWLAAHRNRFRALQITLLQALATRCAESDEIFVRLDAWLRLAPFDRRPHELLLDTLASAGRLHDAEEHLAATIRAFEAEGIDWRPLREAWRARRSSVHSSVQWTPADAPAPRAAAEAPARRRAAVAVMPFVERTQEPASHNHFANGLTEDIIMQLAKLRILFVIARGSVFALRERGVGSEEAGRILNVDYVVSGSVRREPGSRVRVAVELAAARDGRIVWTDAFEAVADEAFPVLDAVVHRIVAAVAEEIEAEECRSAVLKPPSSLDAWEAYHRGLWHMYRFTGSDNRTADQLFRVALQLDPTFARAHAGLSFTHFQNAFLDLTPDRDQQIELAFEAANRSLGADDHDPAAHWAMGRALWLRGAQDESLAELERSIDLSPNFALGHYTLGFVHSQSGDPHAAIEATTYSRKLSPFDPLQFAMLASRAIAHVRLGERDEAADWAVKATARPNAHVHILAIAAECLALAKRREQARSYVGQIRSRSPRYSVEDFLRAFHFAPELENLFRRCARSIGFDR